MTSPLTREQEGGESRDPGYILKLRWLPGVTEVGYEIEREIKMISKFLTGTSGQMTFSSVMTRNAAIWPSLKEVEITSWVLGCVMLHFISNPDGTIKEKIRYVTPSFRRGVLTLQVTFQVTGWLLKAPDWKDYWDSEGMQRVEDQKLSLRYSNIKKQKRNEWNWRKTE